MSNTNRRGHKVKTAEGTFDSWEEFRRWNELKLLQKAGKISGLRRQVKYELIPAQYETYERYSAKTGKRLTDGRRCIERACTYTADYVYMEGGNEIVEDCKGYPEEDYILKRKMMLYLLGIKIRET